MNNDLHDTAVLTWQTFDIRLTRLFSNVPTQILEIIELVFPVRNIQIKVTAVADGAFIDYALALH